MISITLPIPTIVSFILGYILVYKIYTHNKNKSIIAIILILFLTSALMKHILFIGLIIGMYLSFIINIKLN